MLPALVANAVFPVKASTVFGFHARNAGLCPELTARVPSGFTATRFAPACGTFNRLPVESSRTTGLPGEVTSRNLPYTVNAGVPRTSGNTLSVPERVSHTVNRSEEHTSELQSPCNLVCRLLL